MLDRKSIILGIYLSYFQIFVSIISSFVLTPILIKYLGQSAYGLWATLGSIIGYLSLLNFGMNAATVKYTAEYSAKNDKENLNRLISTVFVGFILILAFIILICVGLAPFISGIFHLTEDLASVGQIAFLIVSFNVAIGFLGGFFGNIIYGYQRVDILKAFGIVQAIASALLTVWFLSMGFGLIGAAIAPLLSTLILIAMYLLFIHRSNYGIVIHPKLADIKTLKEIAPFSIRSFSLGLTSQILYYTDNIIISTFLGVSSVTSYSIAYQLCFLLTSLFSVVTQAFFPAFTKLYVLEDIDGLRLLYIRNAKIATAIVTPLALGVYFFGQPFINLWVGEENFIGMNVLLVFIFMLFLHAFGTPPGILLQAIGKNREFMYSEILNAGLHLLVSVILVMKMGLLGLALGTPIAHLCTSSWVVPLLACKYTHLPVKTYIRSCILPPLLVGIPVWVITWLYIQNLYPDNNFFYLFFKGILIMVLYIAIYLAVAATKEERQIYLGLVPKIG